VIRPALLSIVLALAVGSNVSLLCKVWCHPATDASGCHYDDSSAVTRVAGDVDCSDIVVGMAAVTREGLWRGPARETIDAVVVVPYQFAPSTIDIGPALHACRVTPFTRRPLVTVLRI
jgi:hypothetical protein